MRLYEFEAKKVLEGMGVGIPKQYGTIHSPEDLEGMGLRSPVMLKSMVLVGGRGKAGGIKRAESLDQAKSIARSLFELKIGGYRVETVLVEESLEGTGACYVGATMDPGSFNPVVMVSASGGVEIEEVARQRPAAIEKRELPDNDRELPERVALELASFLNKDLGQGKGLEKDLAQVIANVYATYQRYDCKVCEVNPLIITSRGPVVADAKIVLDDNALYRQVALFEALGITERRHDIAEPTRNELRAMDAGFPYLDLLPEDAEKEPGKLYVGLVPGGAGYGIFSIDEVVNIGSRFFEGRVVPVDFMDSGGGPPQSRVAEMFHLLMDYELVDLIITSRFGGISSCDVFIRGLIQCLRERHQKGMRMIPVYGRMVGTDLPSARTYLEKATTETPEPLRDLHIVVGNERIMADVIREGIEKGFESKGSQ